MTCLKTYLLISGTVFAVVCILHLVRLVRKLPIQIGTKSLPMWVSIAGMIGTGLLSAWAFSLCCGS